MGFFLMYWFCEYEIYLTAYLALHTRLSVADFYFESYPRSSSNNMATTGGASIDGLTYAEYSPKMQNRSDAEIDKRLVSMCFYTETIYGLSQIEADAVFLSVSQVTSMTANVCCVRYTSLANSVVHNI